MKRTIRFLTALLVLLTTGSNIMWAESITYLKYVGGTYVFEEATANATKITSESNDISGYCYVEGNVTINGKLDLHDDTHLILCDDAELTINSSGLDGIFLYSNLTIYAQSSGTHAGKLTINSSGNSGIIGVGDVTINGGIINILSGSTWGIDCYNFTVNGGKLFVTGNLEGIISDGHDVTINGGQVYVTVNGDGIDTTDGHDVTINGGKVSATGGDIGIGSDGAINLGWTNAEDYIEVSKYNVAISTATGKDFNVSGGTTLDGGVTVDAGNYAGKKLTPNTTASIYTISLGTGISADNVSFDRSKAFAGERVAVTVTPPTGKILASLTCSDGTNDYAITQQANDYVITLPATTSNVTVTVNATFVTPVAQIGDTKYATLAAALAAVNDGETITILSDKDESGTDYSFGGYYDTRSITIDMNGCTVSFGNITNKYGDLTITDNSTNHNGIFNFGTFGNQGNTTIKDVTVNCNWIDNAGGSDHTLTFDNAKVVCSGSGIQWMSSAGNVVLTNGADVEVHNTFFLAYDADNTFTMTGETTILKLVGCKFTGYVDNSDKIRPYVKPDLRSSFAFEVEYGTVAEPYVLRSTWGLQLTSNLGYHATVTFYAGGTSEPTGFDVSNPGTAITEADAGDWIVAHIVPDPGYWTDLSLLMVYEAGGALSRTRGLVMVDPYKPKLLQADKYNAAPAGDPVDMQPRHDGAGWYYYQIPADHTVAKDFTSNVVDGDVVKQFDLNYSIWNGTHVSQNGNIVTVTNDEGWTAILTLDAVSFKFTGNEIAPTIESLVVKKDETEMFNLTTPTQIAQQLELSGYQTIKDKHCPYITAIDYSWFKNYDWIVVQYAITVPFDGSGTENDPWQIKTDKDLNLLAKCVNVGDYDFKGEYLKQINEIDMGNIDNFLPIGATEYWPFRGWYNGDNKRISNLTIDISVLTDVENIMYSDVSGFVPVGLFGFVRDGIVEKVILSNGSISYNSDMLPGAVGGIVGMMPKESVISNSTISNTTITATGKGKEVCMGGIAGLITVFAEPLSARAGSKTIEKSATPTNTIESCTVDACTISNTMTDGVETSDYIDMNWTGGIVGMAVGGSLSGNRVTGATKITSDINLNVDCPLGAIFGEITSLTPTSPVTSLSDNKYAKAVELIKKKATGTTDAATTTVNGYTKRGYWNWDATPEAWDDINDATEGAMMEVYPATLSLNEITGYSPSLEIDVDDPSTPAVETLVAGTNCYEIVAKTETTPAYYYFAPGDDITLAVSNTLTRTDDGRTFHADLSLTMNDNDLTVTDGKATFTMPSSAATVAATYTEADWFTVPSNGQQWMSFYHEWEATAPANYTVSDGDGTGKTIEALTVSSVDSEQGSFTTTALKEVVGESTRYISYSAVPTLFHCESYLPPLLKFEPNTTATKPDPLPTVTNFIGVSTDTDLSGENIYMINGEGDFIRAYLTETDKTLAAHRCYLDLSDNPTAHARLHNAGEANGIVSTTLDAGQYTNDKWYSIDGRKFDSVPTKKGVYIYKGKKIVVR